MFEIIASDLSLVAVIVLMLSGLLLAWRHSISISRRIADERSGRYAWGQTPATTNN